MFWWFGAKAPRIPKIGIKWLSVGIKYRSLNPNFANKISNIIYILKKNVTFLKVCDNDYLLKQILCCILHK